LAFLPPAPPPLEKVEFLRRKVASISFMAEFADDGDCADWLAPAAANSYGTQPGLPQADKMALDN